MKKYILTGKFIDLELSFNTIEEAEKQLKEWLEEDKVEFPNQNTIDDYYIIEEGETE